MGEKGIPKSLKILKCYKRPIIQNIGKWNLCPVQVLCSHLFANISASCSESARPLRLWGFPEELSTLKSPWMASVWSERAISPFFLFMQEASDAIGSYFRE